MEIKFDDALIEYMQQKNKSHLMVEIVSTQNSDFDVTEICLRFVSDKFAKTLKEKKGYRSVLAPVGEVLMPPYRLQIEPFVTFHLKKFWFIKWITQDGISL